MDRSTIIDTLDKATDRAAEMVIHSGMPISVSKKSILIGNTLVEKNSLGFYNVSGIDKKILYSDISVFDVAVIVAQRHSAREYSVVKKVLYLEEKYSKYRNDMIHYLHCYRSAKKQNDYDRMCILEDKFQVAELLAKSTRDSITLFKRVR